MLIKEDFTDTMISLRDKVKNTYDYLKGNRSNNLGTLYDASSAEIKSNATLYKLTQEFDKSKAPYRVQFDKMGKKLLFTFDASKVPTDLVDQFKPNGKYGKKVNSYDPSSKSVEMIFDAAPSKLPEADRALYKDAKNSGGNEVVGTDESLKEELTVTVPEPYYNEDRDEFYLKMDINGSTYDFTMKDDSPYSIDQMLNKVVKMMNYSPGKALAFIKKNMTGVKSGTMRIKESNDYSTYEEIDSKEVMDSNGFYTEYTLYTNGENFICIFGDRDLYTPEDTEPDFETESEKEAREWFANYRGFEDEDDSYYDESLNESEDDDGKTSSTNCGNVLEYDIKNEKNDSPETESVNPSDLLELKSISYQGLRDELTKELNKVMKSPEFGFEGDEISGVEIKEDEGQVYVSVWAEVGFDALWAIKDALDPIIAKYDKDAYFDMEDVGRLLAVISDSKLKESGNPFKSHHICQGCGKPLDQCTCAVEGEEAISEENLNETIKESLKSEDGWSEEIYNIVDPFFVEVEKVAYEVRNGRRGVYRFGDTVEDLAQVFRGFSEMADSITDELDRDQDRLEEDCGTSATQTSGVGQHKVGSIDLLEPQESLNLDPVGKRLKKLISQLVLDSDEELRDYVNKIIDEVIEERSGGPDGE